MENVLPSLLLGESLPAVPTMIGVYETPRSRKFVNLFVCRETPDISSQPWELWFSDNHLVGYFDWETCRKMLQGWSLANKDIRVNNRISR